MKKKKAKNGISLTTKGFDYNPSWGGAFQNGGEMNFFQNGLDFKPKSMQNGGGITNEFLLRQAYKESTLNPKAKSKAGATGIAQIKQDALNDYLKANKLKSGSIDLTKPEQAIKVQKWYMNNLYNASFINKPNQTEEVRLAKTLAAYNWGRGNLANYLNEAKKKGKDIYKSLDWLSELPLETRDYVNKIALKKNEDWENEYTEAIKKNPNAKYYQEKQQGGPIEDDRGQWAHPGKVTKINSNQITMKGVDYPVLGISDTGDIKLMQPNQDYSFSGESVTEYPMKKTKQSKGQLKKLKQLTDFGNPPIAQDGTFVQSSDDIVKDLNLRTAMLIEQRRKGELPKPFNANVLPTLPYPGSSNKPFVFGSGNPNNADKSVRDMDLKGLSSEREEYLLNLYKSRKSKGVLKNGGKLDKYQFSGQPLPTTDFGVPQQQPLNWGSQNLTVPNQFSVQGQAQQSLNQAQGVSQQMGQGLPAQAPAGLTSVTGLVNEGLGIVKDVINVGNLIKGIGKKRQEARRRNKLAKLTKKASNLEPDDPERKYVRPEDQIIDPNTVAPSSGVGTDYLAEHGAEIQNTYASNTLYTDLEEKQLGGVLNAAATVAGPLLGQSGLMNNNASQIGQIAGKYVKGPVGQVIGGIIGGGINKMFDLEGSKYDKETNKINKTLGFQNNVKSLKSQYTGFMEDGGELRTGGHLSKNSNMDGELETYWGGHAETMSNNPHLPGSGETVMFKGASHDDGGIGMRFGKKAVEVEGGEPAVKLKDGGTGQDNLTIFGDMKIPDYGVAELGDPKAKGKKFKNYIKDLSLIEQKQNKVQDKGLSLINDTEVKSPFDKLKVSSGEAMLIGTDMKLKDIAEKKKTASLVQNAILETADELGLKPNELSNGKIKKARRGMKIAQDSIPSDELPSIAREVANELVANKAYDWETRNRLVKTLSEKGYKDPKGSDEYNKWFKENYSKNKGKVIDSPWGKMKMELSGDKKSKQYLDVYDEDYIPNMTVNTDALKKLDIDPKILDKRIPAQTAINDVDVNTPQEGKEKEKFDWMGLANSILPFIRPSNSLGRPDLNPEYHALATNQQDPVHAQLYNPLLEQPFDISLQDQLNANQADFNSIQRLAGNNPSALATLAGQKYAANTNVLAEQFRQNQANKAGVFNRNRLTLNDAQLKNLGILDKQFERFSQAKSNTKAVAQQALNSISDKLAKNKLENRTLDIYENLYNYRFLPNGMAMNMNPLVDFEQMIQNASPESPTKKTESTEVRQKFNPFGLPKDREVRKKTTKETKNGGIVKAIKNL